MFPTKIKIEWEPCPLLRLNPSWVLGRFSQLFLIPLAVLFFCIPWLWARNARKSIETLFRWYRGSICSLNIEVIRKTVKGSLCLEEVSWVRWLADWSRDPLLFSGHHLRFWILLCSFYVIPLKSCICCSFQGLSVPVDNIYTLNFRAVQPTCMTPAHPKPCVPMYTTPAHTGPFLLHFTVILALRRVYNFMSCLL